MAAVPPEQRYNARMEAEAVAILPEPWWPRRATSGGAAVR
jgi:hypothetical protein